MIETKGMTMRANKKYSPTTYPIAVLAAALLLCLVFLPIVNL